MGANGWLCLGLCNWCWPGRFVGRMVVFMTDRDIMQQALDALEIAEVDGNCCYEATELLRTRLAQPEQEPVVDERIKSVRHMRDVQGYDGNWNYDPYMQGLYNGLEFALSLLEVRQPEFKDAPATWLGDIKFKRDKLSSGAAHGIK